MSPEQAKGKPVDAIFDTVNGCDIGVIQRRQHLRFACKASHAVGIICKCVG
jgi:hypothetical protein